MSSRDRIAAHVVREGCDFTKLRSLPKPVAFQARLFEKKKDKVWWIGTRHGLKKWTKKDDPFSEFAPDGSPKFVKLAKETASSFCETFDELHKILKKDAPGSQYIGYGPSKKLGELSLGLQIATMLGTRVLSFIVDDDPDEAILICISEPERIVKIRCEKAGIHFHFESEATIVSAVQEPEIGIAQPGRHDAKYAIEIDDGAPCADEPNWASESKAIREKWLNSLAKLRAVSKGDPPTDYFGDPAELISQELNAFVGSPITSLDTVIPDYSGMVLLAQRAAGGELQIL